MIDTPLAESGIIGTAIGLALRGYRPVCEIQFDGFVFPAFNQITTQLAKMHARSDGQRSPLPVVIRIPYGGGIGSIEHHSESPEALFAHTAGPAHHHPVQPARRLLDDPAGRRLPGPGDLLRAQAPLLAQGRGGHRRRPPATPFKAQVVRAGTDATVVAYGPLVPVALAAADGRGGGRPSVEVIDLRSISPIDFDTVDGSVEKTGRLVVAHEAPDLRRHRRRNRRPDQRTVLLLAWRRR